jgi:hypothetical protein
MPSAIDFKNAVELDQISSGNASTFAPLLVAENRQSPALLRQ